MSNKLTNLLSPQRLRELQQAYFVRLATIAMVILSILITTYGLLRVPTYIYLKTELLARQQTLVSLSNQLSEQNASYTSARLASLNNKALFVSKLADAPSAITASQRMLSISRKGITLTSMTYASAVSKNTNTVTLTGIALTRVALQHYQQALERASFVTKASLPVNVYAKNTNIKFTMTVTETFLP